MRHFFVLFLIKEKLVLFRLETFKETLSRLINVGWGRYTVEEINKLCHVEAVEAGYHLEDAGVIENAESVLDLSLHEFNELLNKEAA